jgi:predicted secreted hydrolase
MMNCSQALIALLANLLSFASEVPTQTPDGFTIARPGYGFAFPRDHGSHPTFRTEWWYFTGHLWSLDGKRRFGYQLTFFRQGAPIRADSKLSRATTWRSDQIFLAHGTLTDESGQRFLVGERLNRAGLVADAAEDRLAVFNESWRAEQDRGGTIRLHLSVQGATLDLTMQAPATPVIFGEDGVSRKGSDPSAASHYLTFPRLPSSGSLKLPNAAPISISGSSWMDHEFSSNQLSTDQVGWDWAGIQLRDGRSLMAYRMRRQDGTQDPFSSITEVDPEGHITRSTKDFKVSEQGAWTSPASRTRYPQPITFEAWGERYTLVPLLKDQELRTARSTGITYWEGACRVLDGAGKEIGDAYLEQTGYAHSLKGRF